MKIVHGTVEDYHLVEKTKRKDLDGFVLMSLLIGKAGVAVGYVLAVLFYMATVHILVLGFVSEYGSVIITIIVLFLMFRTFVKK